MLFFILPLVRQPVQEKEKNSEFKIYITHIYIYIYIQKRLMGLCVMSKRKRNKRLMSTSNIISKKCIIVILAIYSHCIFFSRAVVKTCSFSGCSAISTEERPMNTEPQINLKIFGLFWKKTPSQALEMLQQEYGDNTMSCTHVLQWH